MNKIILLNVFYYFEKNQEFGLTPFAKENGHKYYRAYGGKHPGWDFTFKRSNNLFVRAAHSGIVVKDDDIDDNGAGINISIFNPEQKIATRYYHLANNNVYLDNRVAAGDIIGIMGNTGASEGIHLHFGLYRTDANGVIIDKDNGYKGAIDPAHAYWQEWSLWVNTGHV